MPAPTFVQEVETTWTATTTTTRTVASFAVQVGDILVACMLSDDFNNSGTLTASGGSLTWTQQQTVTTFGGGRATLATATATTTTSMTATVTKSLATSVAYGMTVLSFRGSGGVGASAQSQATNSPLVNLTTTQANSALVIAVVDSFAQDGVSRVWRANAGPLTERTYQRILGVWTTYAGYHADAGAVGTYGLGLTAPIGQTDCNVAVEILGTGGAATFAPPPFQRPWRLRRRLVIR
jgi:hypothetical protein